MPEIEFPPLGSQDQEFGKRPWRLARAFSWEPSKSQSEWQEMGIVFLRAVDVFAVFPKDMGGEGTRESPGKDGDCDVFLGRFKVALHPSSCSS
jgi:hypothetical protein